MSQASRKNSKSQAEAKSKVLTASSQSITDCDSDYSDTAEVFPEKISTRQNHKQLCIKLIECMQDSDVAAALNTAVAPFLELAVEEGIKNILNEHNRKLEKITQENVKLSRTVHELTQENAKLKERLENSEKNVDEVEKVQRSSNLIIRGLPERTFAERTSPSGDSETATAQPSYESVEKTVTEFVQTELNIALRPEDISSAFRIKAGEREKSRPILIRFSNLKVRHELLVSRKILRERKLSVFIDEHLGRTSATLFARARALVKKQVLHSAWTRNGSVYIKRLSSSTPSLIKSLTDLPRLPEVATPRNNNGTVSD